MNTISLSNFFECMDDRYFLITKDLFDLESDIQLRMPKTRFVFNGSGDGELFYLRDSLHITRRYEYPWVALNIPHDAKSIVDVGGVGSFSIYMSTKVPEYTLLNIDPEVEREMTEIQTYLRRYPNIKCVTKDILHNDLPDSCYDCGVSISTIEHITTGTVYQVIDEMKRIVKPGGIILITMDILLQGEGSGLPMAELSELCSIYHLQLCQNLVNDPNFVASLKYLQMVSKLKSGDVISAVCIKLENDK